MKAHEIIDRLARLDEAAPVEEPVVDPEIETVPEEPAPAPRRRTSSSPYEMPPDFEPGQMPAPKSEDETEAISNWLEATQQPIQDWEWDGHELRLLMDDGTTEVYNRDQLEGIGIFGGEMAFSESEEPDEPHAEEEFTVEEPANEGGEDFIEADPTPLESPAGDATGTLDMILGRTPCGCSGSPEEAGPKTIPIEGEQAAELGNAVSNVIQIILGIASGEPSDSGEKEADNKDGKEPEKKKSRKDKNGDEEEDKKDEDDDKDEE